MDHHRKGLFRQLSGRGNVGGVQSLAVQKKNKFKTTSICDAAMTYGFVFFVCSLGPSSSSLVCLVRLALIVELDWLSVFFAYFCGLPFVLLGLFSYLFTCLFNLFFGLFGLLVCRFCIFLFLDYTVGLFCVLPWIGLPACLRVSLFFAFRVVFVAKKPAFLPAFLHAFAFPSPGFLWFSVLGLQPWLLRWVLVLGALRLVGFSHPLLQSFARFAFLVFYRGPQGPPAFAGDCSLNWSFQATTKEDAGLSTWTMRKMPSSADNDCPCEALQTALSLGVHHLCVLLSCCAVPNMSVA